MGMMQTQTQRMHRLVEDLLVLSRLESNQQSVPEERINLPQLLQTLLVEAQGLSQGRHQIELIVDGSSWLIGSHDELHSAFGNLISNAIRYTPDGGMINSVGARPMAVASRHDRLGSVSGPNISRV